jgi:hypothetical protein
VSGLSMNDPFRFQNFVQNVAARRIFNLPGNDHR